MRELHSWEFSNQELQVIKSALLGVPKNHPNYEQAQEIANQIPVDLGSEEGRKKKGTLEDAVIDALKNVDHATSRIVAQSINESPGAVASTLSRLQKKGTVLVREIPNPSFGTGRGRKTEMVTAYSLRQSGQI